MNTKEFSEVLQKLKGHAERLYFHVVGEPLLHPQLGDFLDLSQRSGFTVTLVTNGTLINQAKAVLQNKPALRQINFSLRSFEGDQSRTALDNYLKPILEFAKASGSQDVFRISLRLMTGADNQQIVQKIGEAFGIAGLSENPANSLDGIKLSPNVYVNQSDRFAWPRAGAPDIPGQGFCLGLRDQIAILADGTIVPCCLDAEGGINLGNIFKQGLEQIVQSERARKMFNGFSKQEVAEKLCRKCSYRLRFNPGRA
jgi:radical SAM protein with 4Fe4S-binding SPASM domain